MDGWLILSMIKKYLALNMNNQNPDSQPPIDPNQPENAGVDLNQKNFENQPDQNANRPDQSSENPPEDIFAEVDPTQQNLPAPVQSQPYQNPPNPQPPAQPQTTPPQQSVEQQYATGLESQPILAEQYVPEPDYQKGRLPKSRVFLKIFLVIVVVLIIGGGAAFFLLFFNKGTLKLTVNPPEALVKIDDQEYPTEITYQEKLAAGEHILNISLEGYIEYEKKIDVANLKTTEINVDLHQIPEAKKILSTKMDFIALSPDKKYLVGYGTANKTFYRIPIEENQSQSSQNSDQTENPSATALYSARAITETTFANIVDVIWNPEKELAILKIKNAEEDLKNTDFWREETSNGAITTWLYDFNRYDLANQEATYLGNDIGEIVWTPDGNKIIYYRKGTVFRASPNNSDPSVIKKVSSVRNPSISISPDGKLLALIPQTTKYSQNYLYKLDLYSKELTKLTDEGDQKGTIFNTDSTKIVFSKYDQDPNSAVYSSLSIIGADGNNRESLNLRTLIDKVRFIDENNFLYSYIEDQTESDDLKKFNLETKEEHDYFFTSEDRLRFDQVVLTENYDQIYFLSADYLYQLDLVTDEY